MATSNASMDQSRPSVRTRTSATAVLRDGPGSRSPKTPILGRSISSQFGSPGAFRDQEDVLVYELGARHFSAGYAGEAKPRCILPFTPDDLRRPGDFRQYDAQYARDLRVAGLSRSWEQQCGAYELYQLDLTNSDVGLVEDRLDRALRTVMVDYLQLDFKQPRKSVLTVPSLMPTPLVEAALTVLFSHCTQPPSVTLLTHPVMCCVSAGLRHALVVDIGWEETVITGVGEYKEVYQRRSVRAGKRITEEMKNVLEEGLRDQGHDESRFSFSEVDDMVQRVAWCRARNEPRDKQQGNIELSVPTSNPPRHFSLPLEVLAEPAEKVLFPSDCKVNEHDDEDAPLGFLAYHVLLSLPLDLRSLCVSRVVVAGGVSKMPGLKRRLLQELENLIQAQGWDSVNNYGSAKLPFRHRVANTALKPRTPEAMSPTIALSPAKMPIQDSVPHSERVHDDVKEPITIKAERQAAKGKMEPVKGIVRGVESLGPWAGASLLASMRIKGVHEIEREDFLRNGLRQGAADV